MRKNGGLRDSGKRSRLEEKFAAILEEAGIEQEYEVKKIKYVVPESNHTYLIDFSPLKLNIEVKGLLRDYDERHKYQLVKEQHPDLDLRFVFDNWEKKVPGTKMSHKTWAEKLGFKCCDIRDKEIILGWLQEDNNNKKES
jgi:hypothetical protein